ncbi:MAG TPA: hypothetical protein VG474_13645 [Solirubrobacteraceae bacterium]|nr:hypothetical protein [Solirubrobacteraceae bacterium]
MSLFVRIAIGLLVVVAIFAIVFNPSLWGVLFALIVLVGAGSVWLVYQLFLAESERREDR